MYYLNRGDTKSSSGSNFPLNVYIHDMIHDICIQIIIFFVICNKRIILIHIVRLFIILMLEVTQCFILVAKGDVNKKRLRTTDLYTDI
jgi:hypothetical protein